MGEGLGKRVAKTGGSIVTGEFVRLTLGDFVVMGFSGGLGTSPSKFQGPIIRNGKFIE